MRDLLVDVNQVSKRYCRDLKRSLRYGIRDLTGEFTGRMASTRELRPGEFWAVNDVSFQLHRGECLGLIGGNGAGKSTLLKMLNGLIKPDSGRIRIRGRVGALIELGAGFHPVLDGRENVYINGSILGMKKREIDRVFDDIVDFADIGDAIDAPVRTYSSGMRVRLGFAIAAHLKPDILLIDEVLAVGDIGFRLKCYNRIRELLPQTAVILVSHNMFDIARTCSRALVLGSGRSSYAGGLDEAIQVYNKANSHVSEKAPLNIYCDEMTSEVSVDEFEVKTGDLNSAIRFALSFCSSKDRGMVRIRLVFFDESEIPVAEWDSATHQNQYHIREGRNTFRVEIENLRLRAGVYRLVAVVADSNNCGYTVHIDRGLLVEIRNTALAGAAYKI